MRHQLVSTIELLQSLLPSETSVQEMLTNASEPNCPPILGGELRILLPKEP